MKRPEISEIVFAKQWPNASRNSNEPQSWLSHIQRHIVPEVRQAVQVYFGSIDSLEAQYPALTYSYEPHRRRLARYPWHRRLFRIMDELQLTEDEILSICVWEGTKSAKDKYEQETGRRIIDTTCDGIKVAPRTHSPSMVIHGSLHTPVSQPVAHVDEDIQFSDIDQSEDELKTSVGAQLNEQLLRGEDEMLEDGPLEEWLKYMNDRDADRDSMLHAMRAGHPPPTVETDGMLPPYRELASIASNGQHYEARVQA